MVGGSSRGLNTPPPPVAKPKPAPAVPRDVFGPVKRVGQGDVYAMLYYHAVAPNPDFHGAAGGPGSPGYLHPTDWQRSWGTIP